MKQGSSVERERERERARRGGLESEREGEGARAGQPAPRGCASSRARFAALPLTMNSWLLEKCAVAATNSLRVIGAGRFRKYGCCRHCAAVGRLAGSRASISARRSAASSAILFVAQCFRKVSTAATAGRLL